MSKSCSQVREWLAASIWRRWRFAGAGAAALSLVVLLTSAAAGKPHNLSRARARGASLRGPGKAAASSGRGASLLPLQELPASTRFYLALALAAPTRDGNSPQLQALQAALLKELQTLPGVVVASGAAPPSAKMLEARHLKGFYIDGTVQLQSTAWAGGQKISCQVQMTVATWPHRAVKMMSTQGAALETGATPAEQMLGQRDCLLATVGLTREDIQTYLQTVP